MEAKLIKHGHSYALVLNKKLVAFAHPEDFSENGTIGKLCIDNCQAIERGYDLDELAEEWVFETNGHKWSNNDNTAGDNYSSFKAGFQKALELMGDKKFSEEDIRQTLYLKTGFDKDGFYFYKSNEEIIQSLQQTEWLVEVEMECLVSASLETFDFSQVPLKRTGKVALPCLEERPKLDAEGCLILKRKA